MQRFLLQANIARFQELLSLETREDLRRTLRSLLVTAQRELAILDSTTIGAGAGLASPWSVNGSFSRDRHLGSRFQSEFEASAQCYLILDPRPGLHIIDINDAYGRATFATRAAVAGERLFDVFPDNPNEPLADGVSNLHASLRTAAETSRPHMMAIQRYDVRDRAGTFVTRYWRPVNTPVLDDRGRLTYLLHHVEDVTSLMVVPPAETASCG